LENVSGSCPFSMNAQKHLAFLLMHLGSGAAKHDNLQKIQSFSHNTMIVFIAVQR
jgi:hypothetical protein